MSKFSTGSEYPYTKIKGGAFLPPPGTKIDSQTPVLIGLNIPKIFHGRKPCFCQFFQFLEYTFPVKFPFQKLMLYYIKTLAVMTVLCVSYFI